MVDYPVGTRFDWPSGGWAIIQEIREDHVILLEFMVQSFKPNIVRRSHPQGWVGIHSAKISYDKSFYIRKFNKFAEL